MLPAYQTPDRTLNCTALCLAIVAFAILSNAQTPTTSPATSSNTAVKQTVTADKIKRWFEVEQLSAATRYHFVENANRTKAANNNQYLFVAKFRFKFDPKGRYSIAASLTTGPVFNTSWNASGKGTGMLQKDLNMRQFYFDAKPNKRVEMQIGGLYFNYGEETEAITYDNDSYLTGERVQLRDPKRLYFDEISVTYAAVGDVSRPNIFRRFDRFGKQNYHQFLVRKQFSKQVGFSADYTFLSGIDTFHQAVKVKIPPKHLLDTFLFEQYERVDPDHNYGFNIFGERKLNKMFTASGGFANIHIASLNADRFPPGKRAYVTGQMKLSPEFGFLLQFTRGVGFIAPDIARTRLDIIFTYNILETLHKLKLN